MSNIILRVKNLTKSYTGHRAVSDFNLTLFKGQVYALLGQNGAGKSSVLRILAGIFTPDKGTIELFTDRKIGYLPEERGLYQNMKVLEHLEYISVLRGFDSKNLKDKAIEMLNRVGLNDWHNRLVKELSKGMQQKVQLLASLLHDPELLILDEPFSDLDPVSVKTITDLIQELKGKGSSVIVSAHQMRITESISDTFCFLHQGHTRWQGSKQKLKQYFGRNLYKLKLNNCDRIAWPEELKAQIVTERAAQNSGDEQNVLAVQLELEREEIAKQLLAHLASNYEVISFERYTPSLEEAFHQLTA